jgi:hypothetical protein
MLLILISGWDVCAQPDCTPWGNLLGIRMEGQLMQVETSLRTIDSDWLGFVQSSKYNWEDPLPLFTVDEPTTTVSHHLQGTTLNYTTRMIDCGPGQARQEYDIEVKEHLPAAGTYYCVELPAEDYENAKVELLEAKSPLPALALEDRSGLNEILLKTKAKGIRFSGNRRTLEILADEPTEIFVRQDFYDQPSYLNDPHPRMRFVPSDPQMKVAHYQVYFSILPGNGAAGTKMSSGYCLKVNGQLDREPVKLVMDPGKPGRPFAGISGNYRMSQPALDAQVVDFVFDNLNVTWGRTAFFWHEWQPDENMDPIAMALSGKLSPGFKRQLAIAQRLAKQKIPVIVSVWAPPEWAIDRNDPQPPKGVRLNPAKLTQVADSIASYLVFLKQNYGVEPVLFSFNETDYGVEVRQSPEEHALANKTIGGRFHSLGLATKMLLGDTGACTLKSHQIVLPTQNDPAIHPYLGAIAFHTYHGTTLPDLAAWAESARILNLPLLVTECGPDSAAHRYPRIFTVPWFALQEIETYIRIASVCQPNTIMPWQFNANYSLLAGGGIYGDDSPLHTTQRFWNMKQLGTTPPGAFWMPISADRPGITCAAAGDIANDRYAIHMVNNGTSREAIISGIPASVKKMRVCVTNDKREMFITARPSPVDGTLRVVLPPASYVSLFSE